MATVEVTIKEIDIGALVAIDGHTAQRLASWHKEPRPRLLIQAKDGTEVWADATPEQIELLKMVWWATEGDGEAETLADLRAAYAAMLMRNLAAPAPGLRAAE